MDTYKLPDLRLPFATATHPQTQQIQESTERWCREFGLLRSPSVVKKFRALGYGRIMSTLTPYAPFDGLALIAHWNSFFFVTDDQQNIAVTSNRTALYEDLVASMRQLIAGFGSTAHDDHPLIGALRDLLIRTLPDRPAYWITRFRHNLDLWLTGHKTENSYRVANKVPEVEDYIAVRRDASTVFPTLDLVEMVEQATIPNDLYHSPEYQTLVLGTADIMCWINDIHSLHMEKGDPINFVTVLDHHEHLGIQKAIDAVAARISSRVLDHLNAAHKLPETMTAFGIGFDEEPAVLRCVQDQQSWAAGMEAWDRTGTIRFADSEVPGHGTKASYVEDLL
ncbi:hypothetical protein LWC34_16460 [Kibdelosporangium philippinense]|uniref:Terpene synthase n=1 Tax=Kibdelosporangium philippinense TaxID=211113 RepID=A0ABS8Z974_9PSEU|nr:hypothetical protein [Kibdelosporangium philippinense]MCE7004416.1 hypothetical protein [Kibdelosporangium philippinense]